MNTTFFKEFIVLAEVKNFWEASERLYLNQSTLSKHIKQMEAELGVPLFIRTTRRVELNKYGEALLPYAKSIIKAEYEYSALFMQIQNAEKGTLTLGSLPAMPQYSITRLLSAFQQKYPGSAIKIMEDDPKNLMDLLLSHMCELIFTRETKLWFEKSFLEDNKVVRIPYIRDHLVALLPKKHRLASSRSLTLRELKDEKFCFIKEDSLMYDICVSACQAAGFIPEILFTSHRLDSILDIISTTSCVALLMNQHLMSPERALYSAELPWVAIDITPYIYSQISLCYLKEQRLSASAKNFITLFQSLPSACIPVPQSQTAPPASPRCDTSSHPQNPA